MTTSFAPKDIREIKHFIKRRFKGFMVVFGVISALSIIVAISLPTTYRSQATILIEDQQIPADYVRTTITSYVEQRLQSITQQIMSRSKLLEIIDAYNLYPEMHKRFASEEIIEKMRQDIELETISAEVMDKRTGRSISATIAFSLAFHGKDPATVQRVTNVLASLYLEENLKAREERALATTFFLEEESKAAKRRMDALQDRISAFKQLNMEQLPEFNAINIQAMERLVRDLDQVSLQIRSLQERRIYLEGQLANIKPLSPIQAQDGRAVMNPVEHLKFLRLRLMVLQGTLSDKHPDIMSLKREIAELEGQVELSDDTLEKVRRMESIRSQLAAQRGVLGEKHPDIVRLSKELGVLNEALQEHGGQRNALEASQARPDNPAYINLETQIASTDIQIEGLKKEEKQIKESINRYESRLRNAPLVEKEYNNLLNDYQNARQQYNEIMTKLMEARVSQGMEETQRGERFTIIDPAAYPERPHKPNRIAIVLIGFLLAFGAGASACVALESLDNSVKSDDELFALTGLSILSRIPFMEIRSEVRARRIRRTLWVAGVSGLLCIGLFVIHTAVMPLDVLWIKIERNIFRGF